VVEQLRVARGDVPRDALVEAELPEEPKCRGEPLLAVAALLLDGLELRPLTNMVFPPLSWQTYDIDFTGPGFDASGSKQSNARATVRLNGVVVQDNIEIAHGTGANKKRPELPEGGHLLLQDHGNPVVFRNIWFVPK
jgi:hypothetical protein